MKIVLIHDLEIIIYFNNVHISTDCIICMVKTDEYITNDDDDDDYVEETDLSKVLEMYLMI